MTDDGESTPVGTGERTGPLLLGASGRVGQALRRVAARGLWPGAQPFWHVREGAADLCFDLLADPAPADLRLPPARGVIVLAGVTSGSLAELARNTDLARAGIAFARRHGLGRVIVMSSAGVYGPTSAARSESDCTAPATPYGAAKRDMEAAVAGSGATCLRLANVAGCDALFGAAATGTVRLDRFADGTGPARAYVGPVTLARVLAGLMAHAGDLPPVLNVASPGAVDMADVLTAAGVAFRWVPAPPTALHRLALDTDALARFVPLARLAPAALVAEARVGGWQPAT